ncbi:SDR family oxidoreductase [Deinococcus marmoris]|uniref:SDR family oxidoreductase n=1 Tax=Deinococcus marmoris TaxID=249408 RepID=UPI000495EE0E|nr:SDR family oxidoreductase [Deinococcus marmoris]
MTKDTSTTPPVNNQYEMRDPLSQYPRPPFPRQPQSAPGLASEMDPKPDHGEDSYVGFGRLKGRKALITGADSGIGRAVAIAFAREGADVALNYLKVEDSDAEEVIRLIEAAGQKAVVIPGDLTDETFCKELVQKAVDGLGGLDILVSNAGKQTAVEAIADLTSEQFDETMKTNIYAMFWITKAALPHMGPGSSIINTTSIQASQPSKNLLDYAMTKAAMANFTGGLAKQVAALGIRVNAVAPGPYWTALQPSGGQPQEGVMKFGESVPLGRPGQPAEIAPLYVLLASQEGSYMTGNVYASTGGTIY